MVPFEVGQYVAIPCDVRPGAFPSEFLVTLETLDGVSSGFVGTQYVKRTDDESRGIIEGIVRKIEDDTITVQLPGSYFTTAMGMTRFSTAWAKDNGAVLASA